ncbi:hypothetical protein OIU77_009548 [Salix suchowensis]|uniref:Uncharacterized protein n=1 Tax=Salix suchowensis TaxID=1278906 RepID=A0ABQ9AGN5_9ROSI|nr:hypothetical protein OIU77_009548 [Salix suchowensis]
MCVGCKFKEMTPWFQKFNRYSSPLDCALQTVKNEGHFSWRFYNVAFWTAVLPLDLIKSLAKEKIWRLGRLNRTIP